MSNSDSNVGLLLGLVTQLSGGLPGQADQLGHLRLAGRPQPETDQQLLPEVVTDQTVDKEVDAGVEDGGEVRNVSETLDPSLREKEMMGLSLHIEILAGHYGLQVIKLPDVDDSPWRTAADEDDDDTEEDHEHVHLLPQFPL